MTTGYICRRACFKKLKDIKEKLQNFTGNIIRNTEEVSQTDTASLLKSQTGLQIVSTRILAQPSTSGIIQSSSVQIEPSSVSLMANTGIVVQPSTPGTNPPKTVSLPIKSSAGSQIILVPAQDVTSVKRQVSIFRIFLKHVQHLTFSPVIKYC